MGQKVHPYGFRLGFNRTWLSRWYAEKKYADLLHEDINLRRSLKKKLSHAGIASIEIERAANKLKINILTSRPGIIIGKRGGRDRQDSRRDREEDGARGLHQHPGDPKPELEAQLLSESVAIQLEKRVAFRRAMRKAIESAQRFGAKVIKVRVSGRLGGAEIARSEWYLEGRLEILGVGKISEFTSEQLLSFDACLNCGRCEAACPSNISGMDYSPRSLVQVLHKTMVESLGKPTSKTSQELYSDAFTDFYTWQCTTCGACTLLCPSFINPVDEVVDMRRYQALTTGKLPKSIADTLRNIERQGNPWGIPAQDRLNWCADLNLRELTPGDETDVLYYVGCASAFDDRNKKVARSFVGLLNKANVNFGIL